MTVAACEDKVWFSLIDHLVPEQLKERSLNLSSLDKWQPVQGRKRMEEIRRRIMATQRFYCRLPVPSDPVDSYT